MAEENKEEILANFQSISGIDDIGEAFSHLEETNWDLMAAIQRVIPQEDSTPRMDDLPAPLMPPLVHNHLNSFTASSSSRAPNFINNFANSALPSCNRWNIKSVGEVPSASGPAESAFVPVASTSADTEIIDLTSVIALDSSRHNDVKALTFNIYFNQQIYTIMLPSNATVEQLKTKITDVTKVPVCRQAIRGWSPTKLQDAQKSTSLLSNLGLSRENELILIDMTEEGFMDYESDDVTNRAEKYFQLTITEQPLNKSIELNLSGRTTIQEVKANVYYISSIPVRHQEWTGWPDSCNDNTTLSQSGIELKHNFSFRSLADNTQNNNNSKSTSTAASTSVRTATNNTSAVDTDSSTDEFEDASDFNACEEFFTDSPPPPQPQSRHLIQNNTDDETAGTLQFVENYGQRFGEPNPNFFTGSLEDALREACHKPAKERKLLAIYLHHGDSILTNVFCDHLMKHESILQTLAQNFVLYGWDLTFESNKHLFLSSVTACVNNTASLTVRNIPIDKLPSILIIGKSRLSGRSSCEILSVIHGNVGLDDLLSRFIEAVEMYNEHIQVEIREEDERAVRDQVKAEQDMAYQETLEADMAKEAVKRQKEAAASAERQRIESEKAEEDARRESIRLVAEQSLPEEPKQNEVDITKIRVRKPTGDFLERLFYTQNTLQDLLNYVAACGFLIDEFKLISSWPRRDLTAVDASQTLLSLKLCPQETVILEER